MQITRMECPQFANQGQTQESSNPDKRFNLLGNSLEQRYVLAKLSERDILFKARDGRMAENNEG